MTKPVLYDFFRSTSAWRARIAFRLKGLDYDQHGIWVRGDAHKGADYLAVNPQGLVPALAVAGTIVPQSLAIIEYLEAVHPQPAILPSDELERAMVRSAALLIACDIHPINNRRVLQYLTKDLRLDDDAVRGWERHWVVEGFRGLEVQALNHTRESTYLFGDTVSLADICLVPQVANATRAGVDMSDFPRLAEVHARLEALPTFQAASPERQPDAISN
jgi:maleylacetoacetate isomerase/maleylpyruvate isomerase